MKNIKKEKSQAKVRGSKISEGQSKKEASKIRNLNETIKAQGVNQEVGSKGEKVAEIYFKNKGHMIVDKNYRKLRGEVDLITLESDILHFVEVKTSKEQLSSIMMSPPDLVLNDKGRGEYVKSKPFFTSLNRENLHRDKIKKVVRLSEIYRSEKNIPETIESQIDGLLVTLVYEGDKLHSVKVQHIPHIDRLIEW